MDSNQNAEDFPRRTMDPRGEDHGRARRTDTREQVPFRTYSSLRLTLKLFRVP
jgi:hypothetical protein